MDELLDEAPCGFIIWDDNGIIKEVNATFAGMLSAEKQNISGMKFEQLLNIAGRIFYQTHFFPLLSLHGRAEEIFLTIITPSRQEIPVLINAVRKHREGVWENQGVIIPVYERKKYEGELLQARKNAEESLKENQQLIQAQQELEHNKLELDKKLSRLALVHEDLIQFSNVISHDMQEPVRKIAMFADIIQRDNEHVINEVGKLSINKIKTSSRRMRELITSLEHFVSVNATADEFTDCNLNDIISKARLKAMINSGDHSLSLELQPMPPIEANCIQIELLFYHLFLNTIQFRKEDERPAAAISYDIIKQNRYQSIPGKYMYIDYI
ncbi:MAG: hypothetical protein EOP49_46595, partial [Sphingobacteriales bacterium]